MKTRKAFSLIEVLLVVLVIAVLASIVIPRVSESSGEAKIAKCDSNRANMINALERLSVKSGGVYPPSQIAFGLAIQSNTARFPHGLPICPFGIGYVYDTVLFTVTAHNH